MHPYQSGENCKLFIPNSTLSSSVLKRGFYLVSSCIS
nr:MAG TPA: hypothetical protein [Caudoviricetes sp.]